MRRIIGIGNRYVALDALGPRVCDHLLAMDLPEGVEVVDGGLAGLDLLPLLEGIDRVIFVDGIQGFGAPAEIAVIEASEVAAAASSVHGHSAGLPFLLRAASVASPAPQAEALVVGFEGEPSDEIIAEVARECLRLAVEEP